MMVVGAWVFSYIAAGALTICLCVILFGDRKGIKSPIDNVFEFLLLTCFAVLVWPFTVYFLIEGVLGERRRKRDPAFAERPPFNVGLEDLGETLSLEDVETRERVFDPLGAVSDRPFGHLNPAWERFKAGMAPGAQLAPFSSLYKTWSVSRYDGYAEVSSGPPRSWFISGVRRVE
jgi:hypothetical protein